MHDPADDVLVGEVDNKTVLGSVAGQRVSAQDKSATHYLVTRCLRHHPRAAGVPTARVRSSVVAVDDPRPATTESVTQVRADRFPAFLRV